MPCKVRLNKRVAPADNRYSLLLKFIHRKSRKETVIKIDDSHNMNWRLDQAYEECYTFVLPVGMEKGDYIVGFKLMFEEQLVDIGVKPEWIDDNHFVCFGMVKIEE